MLLSFRSIISTLMIAITAITGLILTSPDEIEALQLENADEIEALQIKNADEIETLQRENAELRRQITVHRTDPVYGILTRIALEEDWARQKQVLGLAIAFFDIDDLGVKNKELGQDETNRRIAKAFSVARRDEVIGRLFSGDEFAILAPKDQIATACDRVMVALLANGMSATAAIILYEGQETLAEAVREAGDLVTQGKAKGKGRTYNFLAVEKPEHIDILP